MKKRILVCLALLPAIVACLLVGVSAHPGKTDSSGGHYDQDTGEYHYHHGYSAHDHYDMDGDGKIDCPYNFDDQTDHSSGNNVVVNSDPVVETPSVTNDTEKRITFSDVLKAMFEALLPTVGVGLSVSYFLSYLFLFLFGDDRGCSITLGSFGIISVVVYLLLIVIDLGLI